MDSDKEVVVDKEAAAAKRKDILCKSIPCVLFSVMTIIGIGLAAGNKVESRLNNIGIGLSIGGLALLGITLVVIFVPEQIE